MSRAVALKLQAHFADPENRAVTSCVWVENPASSRVLIKNGFVETGREAEFCVARDTELPAVYYQLSRDDWKRRALQK